MLDRISQSEDSDPENLFTRVRRAWAHRQDPEALLPQAAVIGAVAKTRGQPTPLSSSERRGLTIAAAGAVIAIVAVFLPWGHDSGKISGYSRLVDTGRWEYVEVDPVGSPGEVELQPASASPPAENAAAIAQLENQRVAVMAAAGSEGLADEEAAAAVADLDDEIARLSNSSGGA